jgi:hypothetical protein
MALVPMSKLFSEHAGKWGSVFTVSIMMLGCILLTLTGIGLSGRQMAIWYIISQVHTHPHTPAPRNLDALKRRLIPPPPML